jgi:hypothetical protein
MIGLGRCYTVTFSAVSITATQDLFYVKPAADKICVLEAVYLSNVGGTADAGDAQEELLRVEYMRFGTIVAGSGGTAPTPTALMQNDTGSSFTARVNDTSTATGASTATVYADGLNIRVPYAWLPPPEHRIPVANASGLVCRLNTAPNDAVLVNGTALVRELP